MNHLTRAFLSFIILLAVISCKEQPLDNPSKEIPHYLRKDNFTVLRVIITNSENQVLMTGGKGFWGMPYINLSKRQYLKEAIDSMAMEHGIAVSNIELRGQFCFKYDYKPNMTLRNYYVAQYKSGEIKVPKSTVEDEFEKVEWVDLHEAIKRNDNSGIKQITSKIMSNPDVIWGGSFLVSHTENDHPTTITENFYPLFQRTE